MFIIIHRTEKVLLLCRFTCYDPRRPLNSVLVVCTKTRLSNFSRHWSRINFSSCEVQTARMYFFKARRAENKDLTDDVNNFQEFQFIRNNVKYNRI
jgi:hypothetical protein